MAGKNLLDITDYPLEMNANSQEWDDRAEEVEVAVNDGAHDHIIRSHGKMYGAGENLTEGDCCYLNTADGLAYRAIASGTGTMFPFIGFARETKLINESTCIVYDFIDGMSLTAGQKYYMSDGSAGTILTTAPVKAKCVGIALTSSLLQINREGSRMSFPDSACPIKVHADLTKQERTDTSFGTVKTHTYTRLGGDKYLKIGFDATGNAGQVPAGQGIPFGGIVKCTVAGNDMEQVRCQIFGTAWAGCSAIRGELIIDLDNYDGSGAILGVGSSFDIDIDSRHDGVAFGVGGIINNSFTVYKNSITYIS